MKMERQNTKYEKIYISKHTFMYPSASTYTLPFDVCSHAHQMVWHLVHSAKGKNAKMQKKRKNNKYFMAAKKRAGNRQVCNNGISGCSGSSQL